MRKRKKIEERECVICNTVFLPKYNSVNTCSPKCKKQRHKDTQKAYNMSGIKTKDFEDSVSKGYAINRGREDMKKMKECTIECLLKEFGDIE